MSDLLGEQKDLTSNAKRDEFLMAQLNSLTQGVSFQIAERRKVEAQTFIGIAVIYAWIFTRSPAPTDLSLIASLTVPFVLAILGLLRWLGIMSRIMDLAAYIDQLECSIIGERGGWERYLKNVRSEKPIVGNLEGIAEGMAWTILIAASAGILAYSAT